MQQFFEGRLDTADHRGRSPRPPVRRTSSHLLADRTSSTAPLSARHRIHDTDIGDKSHELGKHTTTEVAKLPSICRRFPQDTLCRTNSLREVEANEWMCGSIGHALHIDQIAATSTQPSLETHQTRAPSSQQLKIQVHSRQGLLTTYEAHLVESTERDRPRSTDGGLQSPAATTKMTRREAVRL